MLIAQLMIAKCWDRPGCMSADDWMEKVWCVHPRENYSAIKKHALESLTAKQVH